MINDNDFFPLDEVKAIRIEVRRLAIALICLVSVLIAIGLYMMMSPAHAKSGITDVNIVSIDGKQLYLGHTSLPVRVVER